jgi:hypothetical protein
MVGLFSFPYLCKIGAKVLDPFKRCSRQTGQVKLQGNNFVPPYFLLSLKLYNFVTRLLLVKITYCLEGKMVTLRALNKHNMQKSL